MPRRVFITGASGFIGRAVAARLRAAGDEVGGVDLRADPANDVVAGDVRAPGAWQERAAAADLVIHTAADLSGRTERVRDFWTINVLATKHAVDAATGRFVHLSSVAVFGSDFPDGVDETYPVFPKGLPYADMKIASEQVVLQAHAEGRAVTTVIRPGDVYGPASAAWAVKPVALIRARRFVLPAGGIFSPVYIDDLAAGVHAAATSDAAAGQVITLAGGIGVRNEDFFAPYFEALGKRVTKLRPRAAQRLARVNARLPGDQEANPRSAEFLSRRGTYSIAKARELLGWQPETPLAEGQRRTLAWLRESGLVP